ncbi:hypothetical protein BFP76_11050 [Amylibacter kogurei]|uniref:ATPase AAA-type core domain-containing protein n=1 Tax=Paramylibacter kogurei TaxID=1889778 RepID=A0A2G5KBN2_9RHOB|nr:AAA family ATPase [Amylibacter kogurei]PIB26452.1 hypothetical protein BFP76_11050 [Amylibacter kogurei]
MQHEQRKTGFHLISFQTKSTHIPLFTNEDFEPGAKASVIIGPNGSGKSHALAALANELTNIHRIYRNKYREPDGPKPSKRLRILETQDELPGLFPHENKEALNEADVDARIMYALDGDVWEVSRYGREIKVRLNERSVGLENLQFADRVLALAHLPLDKFRFAQRADEQFYRYLGLRQSNNMTTTGALSTQALISFLEAMDRPSWNSFRVDWLERLELASPFYIGLDFRMSELLKASQEGEFLKIGLDYLERRQGSARFRVTSANQDWHDQLVELWPFVKAIRPILQFGETTRGRKGEHLVPITPPVLGMDVSYSEIARYLLLGRKLQLFGQMRLLFTKGDEIVAFDDLSSGEQHILSTTSQLLANLGERSVVLIDEPEISLHPDWQRQYIPSLLNTFTESPETHAVIATHSHFLVSDVEETTGSLTVANANMGHFDSFDGDVFGRSADNILYRVFGLGSAGNRYVEHDLATALKMISGTEDADLDRLREINERLRPLASHDNAALREILGSIKVYLERETDA